jgi:hypothetical protein
VGLQFPILLLPDFKMGQIFVMEFEKVKTGRKESNDLTLIKASQKLAILCI